MDKNGLSFCAGNRVGVVKMQWSTSHCGFSGIIERYLFLIYMLTLYILFPKVKGSTSTRCHENFSILWQMTNTPNCGAVSLLIQIRKIITKWSNNLVGKGVQGPPSPKYSNLFCQHGKAFGRMLRPHIPQEELWFQGSCNKFIHQNVTSIKLDITNLEKKYKMYYLDQY